MQGWATGWFLNRLENKECIMDEPIKYCEWCGKELQRKPYESEERFAERRYCDIKCSVQTRRTRKIKPPPKIPPGCSPGRGCLECPYPKCEYRGKYTKEESEMGACGHVDVHPRGHGKKVDD